MSQFSTKLDLLRIENLNFINEENDIEFKFARMDGTSRKSTGNINKYKYEINDIYLDRKNNKNPIYQKVINKLNSNNLYNLVWDIDRQSKKLVLAK